MLKPLLLTVLLATTAPAIADEGVAIEFDLEHARELHRQSRALRAEAEAGFRAAEPECYRRFLVNRCLDNARQERLERIREARAMEIQARRIELAERQREAAEQGLPTGASAADRDIPPPTEIDAPVANERAEAIRERRAAEAERASAQARDAQAQRDAERQEARERTEAAAARRAEQAERDRARYDERIRKREEKLEESR